MPRRERRTASAESPRKRLQLLQLCRQGPAAGTPAVWKTLNCTPLASLSSKGRTPGIPRFFKGFPFSPPLPGDTPVLVTGPHCRNWRAGQRYFRCTIAEGLGPTPVSGGSMHRRSLVAIVALVVSLAAGRAEAVTVRDVIELSKAGLSDSVLLTLIDVDRSVFSIDTDALKQLKSAGVSDAVIVAMIRSGRERPVDNTPPPP